MLLFPPAEYRRGKIVSEVVVNVNDILALVYSKVRLPQVPVRQQKPSGGRDVRFIHHATTGELEGISRSDLRSLDRLSRQSRPEL